MSLITHQLTKEDKAKRIEKWQRFCKVGGRYMFPFHEGAVRDYKIYNSMADSVDEPLEEDSAFAEIFLPYGYGLVEQMVSKVVEPILNSLPPVPAKPKRDKDEERIRNYNSYLRQIYQSPFFQLAFPRNVRERIITGWSWRIGTWEQIMQAGMRWEIQRMMREQPEMVGRVLVNLQVPYEDYVEVPHEYQEYLGYKPVFPSIFDMFSEPGKRSGEYAWTIQQIRSHSFDDLAREKIMDHTTGQLVPRYDLTELLEAAGAKDPSEIKAGEITPKRPDEVFGYDFGDQVEQAITNTEDLANSNSRGDINRVHLSILREANEFLTIASCSAGTFVISVNQNPLHRPRPGGPVILENYVQDNLSPFGKGIIRPNASLLLSMNDLQNWTMEEGYQAINQLLLIKDTAVVNWDDFKPQGGGKVRITGSANVNNVAMPITNSRDAVTPMLNHQSNAKGFIEFASASMDNSPGTEGTKQSHKTLGGLEKIQRDIDTRIGTLRRETMAGFAQEGEMIWDFLLQYFFTTIGLTVLREDGTSEYKELGRDDMVGEDRPSFTPDYDPTYGDDNLKREMMLAYYDRSEAYERTIVELQAVGRQLEAPEVDLGEVWRRLTLTFGFPDTSRILKAPNGVLTPQQEFSMMVQGQPVQPNPLENLIQHLKEHIKQRTSPELAKMIEMGTVDPSVVVMLDAHIQATQATIIQLVQNPQILLQLEAQKQAPPGAAAPAAPAGPQEARA